LINPTCLWFSWVGYEKKIHKSNLTQLVKFWLNLETNLIKFDLIQPVKILDFICNLKLRQRRFGYFGDPIVCLLRLKDEDKENEWRIYKSRKVWVGNKGKVKKEQWDA